MGEKDFVEDINRMMYELSVSFARFYCYLRPFGVYQSAVVSRVRWSTPVVAVLALRREREKEACFMRGMGQSFCARGWYDNYATVKRGEAQNPRVVWDLRQRAHQQNPRLCMPPCPLASVQSRSTLPAYWYAGIPGFLRCPRRHSILSHFVSVMKSGGVFLFSFVCPVLWTLLGLTNVRRLSVCVYARVSPCGTAITAGLAIGGDKNKTPPSSCWLSCALEQHPRVTSFVWNGQARNFEGIRT